MLYILGRAASGKTFLADKLKELGYKQVISKTTRARRPGEGDTHLFVNSAELCRDIDNDRDIAKTKMNGYWNWITEECLKGKDFMVIDYVGICELGLKKGMKLLYLVTDEDIRRNKYKDRGVNDFIERDEAERQQFSNFEKHSAVLGADVVVIRNEYDKKSEEEMVKKAVELLTK